MKIVFMGTPNFSIPSLKAISSNVVCVYTQPPKPKNRGHKITKTPIHLLSEELGIEVRCPKSLKEEQLPECDLVIVVAYGLILPKHILMASKMGCINIHASLLPRWRGAAPIHRSILSNDKESGITIMQMDEGLDTGDILSMESIPINAETTFQTLHDALSVMGARLLVETLSHPLKPQKQPQEGVTYATKIQKEEGILELNWPSDHILRHINALNPWPGTHFKEHDFKILKASKGPKTNLKPGTFFDDIFLACGQGESIYLEYLQRFGGRAMDSRSFMRGRQNEP
jgi:methionyl-tRNA formyltransferase